MFKIPYEMIVPSEIVQLLILGQIMDLSTIGEVRAN